jgi:hypothetical protein
MVNIAHYRGFPTFFLPVRAVVNIHHWSRFNLRLPQCVSLRSGLNTRSTCRFNARSMGKIQTIFSVNLLRDCADQPPLGNCNFRSAVDGNAARRIISSLAGLSVPFDWLAARDRGAMDLAEVIRLLRIRDQILAIMNGPDPDNEIRRWLLRQQHDPVSKVPPELRVPPPRRRARRGPFSKR